MKKQLTPLLIASILLAASLSPLRADVPGQMYYRGQLTGTDAAFTGSKDMTFQIFDASTGGNSKYSETQTAVPIVNGVFTVLIGANTPIPTDVFQLGAGRWLDVAVSGEPPNTRVPLVSAPYAMAVPGITVTGGNVGIGTSAPAAALDVQSSFGSGYNAMLNVQDTTDPTIGATRARIQNPKSSLILSAYGSTAPGPLANSTSLTAESPSQGLLIGTQGGFPVSIFTNNQYSSPSMTIDSTGKIGVGTAKPAVPFDVNGQIKSEIGGFVFPDGSVQTTAATGGGGSSQWVNGAAGAISYTGGNVGIGTTSPGAKLSFGQQAGAPLVYDYDGGAAGRYGSGIQPFELQTFFPNVSHWSINSGGDLNASGTNEIMRIMGTGNVGIGTIAPGSRLDVVSADNSANPYFRVLPLNLTASVNIGYNHIFEGGSNGNNSLDIDAQGAGNVILQANGGTGFVGIGTTSPMAALDVRGTSGIMHVAGNKTPSVGQNALTGGVGETDLINNQGGGGGGFAFMNTSGSGTTLTTEMLITGAGNVGVGTTDPNAALEVANGDIAVSNLSSGVILKATDSSATCFRLTVDHTGALHTSSVTCPH